MTNLVILIGEALLVVTLVGIVSFGAVLAMHSLAILRIPGRDDIVEQSLSDFMIDPVPVETTEHPLDRLARHCEVKIVEPSHAGSYAARPAPRDEKAGHPSPTSPPAEAGGDREASSHAERGTR